MRQMMIFWLKVINYYFLVNARPLILVYKLYQQPFLDRVINSPIDTAHRIGKIITSVPKLIRIKRSESMLANWLKKKNNVRTKKKPLIYWKRKIKSWKKKLKRKKSNWKSSIKSIENSQKSLESPLTLSFLLKVQMNQIHKMSVQESIQKCQFNRIQK